MNADGEKKISNATVLGTSLGWAGDAPVLTAFVTVGAKGWGQGFGGYSFGSRDPLTAIQGKGAGCAANFIKGVLLVCGVDAWEKVKGCNLRVEHDYGKVYRIGHITDELWFDPAVMHD